MIRRCASWAVALGLLLPVAALAQSAPPTLADPDAFEDHLHGLTAHARARTVLVFGLIGLGSGAVVTPDGLVVTNAHVVAGARYAICQWTDGTTRFMVRRGIDYARDLAVLAPEDYPAESLPCYELQTEALSEGDWVLAIGFPGGLRADEQATFSLGQVLGVNPSGGPMAAPVLDYTDAYRTDTAIFSGNSGGPLLDLQGRLVGINGAVDIGNAVSLTIPSSLVEDRIDRLQGGVIHLPGNQVLDPRNNRLLRGFFELLDPMARQMPGQIRDGVRAAREVTRDLDLSQGPGGILLPQLDPLAQGRDDLADRARLSPRQEALRDAFVGSPAPAHLLEGGTFATLVGAQHLVTKASWLDTAFADENGSFLVLTLDARATLIDVSAEDDLALLRLDAPVAAPVAADDGATGRLLFALDERGGVLAAGIQSVDRRPARAAVAAQIASGGAGPLPPQVVEALARLARIAERFGVTELSELVEQLERAGEIRQSFASGTPPRDYADVLSTDAPILPSRCGGPVYDRTGALVGVSVGVPHHGTSYVVPLARIRQVFQLAR